MKDYRMTSDYQRSVDDFVRRHVHACASHMVQELIEVANIRLNEYAPIGNADIFTQRDYEQAVRDEAEGLSEGELSELLNHVGASCFEDFEPGDWQEAADYLSTDPHEIEALEFWIISNDLAHWLEREDELVDEVLGLNIWGRTCSGQAISMDGVICDIYDSIRK